MVLGIDCRLGSCLGVWAAAVTRTIPYRASFGAAQLAEGVSPASVPWPGLYRLSERQGKLHGH